MNATPNLDMPQSQDKPSEDASPAFEIQTIRVGLQPLRVARSKGNGQHKPLLVFNGIGANIELLEPLARGLPEREVIAFDMPGVGGSPLPLVPYRFNTIAWLAGKLLQQLGHEDADIMGISWGGAVAQQFARSLPKRCHRLILCATATGAVMIPAAPGVLWKMATPRRYFNRKYGHSIAGDIYGGDCRTDPSVMAPHFKHIKTGSKLGYYLQLAAGTGWTSIHWLSRIRQPTLIMAGNDDPLIPLGNAHLMHRLIPNSELRVFDCGHMFLLTRIDESLTAIRGFLDQPDSNSNAGVVPTET